MVIKDSVASSSYSVHQHLLIIQYHFFTDEDEIYNNPNLHSEEQNELEIPDG